MARWHEDGEKKRKREKTFVIAQYRQQWCVYYVLSLRVINTIVFIPKVLSSRGGVFLFFFRVYRRRVAGKCLFPLGLPRGSTRYLKGLTASLRHHISLANIEPLPPFHLWALITFNMLICCWLWWDDGVNANFLRSMEFIIVNLYVRNSVPYTRLHRK